VAAGQSGIIDNHVELPRGRYGPRDKLVAVLPGGHVGAGELTRPAAAPDEVVGGLTAGERVPADVGKQHPEPVRRKPERDRPPDTGRRPGHHG
jgi:hypothetical protein